MALESLEVSVNRSGNLVLATFPLRLASRSCSLCVSSDVLRNGKPPWTRATALFVWCPSASDRSRLTG